MGFSMLEDLMPRGGGDDDEDVYKDSILLMVSLAPPSTQEYLLTLVAQVLAVCNSVGLDKEYPICTIHRMVPQDHPENMCMVALAFGWALGYFEVVDHNPNGPYMVDPRDCSFKVGPRGLRLIEGAE